MTLRLALAGTLLCAAGTAAPVHSGLWGDQGEKWTPASRLADFSFAGYHQGEAPLPDVPQVANVKDFGAVGDGLADDTKAIQAAINATARGAILVPAGRYKITDFVRLEKSGVVLRGAGPGRTTFWFPRGLDEIHPKPSRTGDGKPTSAYSFDGAFLTIEGSYQARTLARISAPAPRGSREVQVDAPTRVAVGDTVLVSLRETRDHSLKTFLYNNDPGDISHGKQLDTKMLVRVVAIEGSRLTFDRPLRFDTRPEWQPEIRSFSPTVTECGIEHIGFEFPPVKYRGHFQENGANAVELRQVAHCWVRDITIHNGDLGINIIACNNTVDGVVYSADSARATRDGGVAACTGHHAIQCKSAEDNLVTNFNIGTCYIHDLSVEHASGNVYAHGRGADLDFDHHKDSPYENLYTDIDCGAGTRVWRCGGSGGLGRQSAGWETFWSIYAARPIAPPPKGWGAPSLNFVGLATETPSSLPATGWWFETLSPRELEPRDLHAAQLARRLAQRTR